MDGAIKAAEAGPSRPADLVTFGFLLLPGVSLLGVISAIDVLRNANRFGELERYSWQTYSLDGNVVKTSNGLVVTPDAALEQGDKLDYLFVCAGFHPERSCSPELLSHLRNEVRHGVNIGAISTGSYILAKAGLLQGRSCTIHWENATSFAELFPDVDLRNHLYVIDGNCFTCSGGTSALDLFLHITAADIGADTAIAIAESLQLDRIRGDVDEQARLHRIALSVKSEKLATVIAAMEANLEYPLSLSDLSAHVRLTRRQLHRLFRRHTDQSPSDYYRDLRLRHARQMLTQTPARILEVAIATGFATHSHFTKCYKALFGHSPSEERRKLI
ncbi:GlxA family transcriptional regulator [Rhodovibrionaceae bacterium A322]